MYKNCILLVILGLGSILSAQGVQLSKAELMGQFVPEKSPDFQKVPLKYASHKDHYLRRETLKAFVQMVEAARKDGVALKIVSSTRNFASQKSIWEGKWKGLRLTEGINLAQREPDPIKRAQVILRFSSMPCTSRHHWGTDLDINSVSPAYFRKPEGKKVYEWLSSNASRFGFCQPYTAKGEKRPHGYEEEEWHWSYLPLSKGYLADYLGQITYAHIRGFAGAETSSSLQVLERFVAGINPLCK